MLQQVNMPSRSSERFRLTPSQQLLAADNYRLVWTVARDVAKGQPTDDMISDGMLALCLAAHDWIPERGPFAKLAARRIRDRIERGITKRTKVRRALSREGRPPDILPLDAADEPTAPERHATPFVEELTDDVLEHLERTYELGHRVVCTLYGLSGYEQRSVQEIASITGQDVQYLYSVRSWSMQLVREYLAKKLA